MEVTRMLSSTLDPTRWSRRLPVSVHVRPRRTPPTPAIAACAALGGALVAFLLDPQSGSRRRSQAAQRAAGATRRLLRRSARQGRYVQGVLEGTAGRVQHAGRRPADVDDLTLTDRVMSEVFGDEDIPKGSIDVNAEHGVIVLRGEVPTAQMIESVESRVRRVSGVRDVRNLLHLPKTPARSNAGPRR